MNGPQLDELTAAARSHLGLPAELPAVAWPVWSPGETDPWYALIEIGEPGAIVAVAAVDIMSGATLGAAHLPGSGPHLVIRAPEAIERAGLDGGSARLVWAPSLQSRSPLYPVWEVRARDLVAYVDQQGTRWSSLEPGGRGGS